MKQNWTYKKLTDVVWFQEGPGVRNTQYTDSGVKLLNVANLINGKVDLSTSKRYISEEEAYGKYRHFLVDEGDFIIASSGIQVEYFEKKMGFISASQLPLCMNTSTIRFKALDKNVLNMRFFMYYLKSEDFKHQLSRQITGIAQLNFGPLHLKRMSMPITDFATQSRIVSELDLLQSIIDKQKAQLKELDNLAQAIFYDMFGDPVENEKGWERRCFKEICEVTSSKRVYQSEWHTSGVPFYRISDFTRFLEGTNIVPELFITRNKYEELKLNDQVPEAGDILITSRGTLGNCYIVKDDDRFYFQDGMITWLRRMSKQITPLFIVFLFKNSSFRCQIDKNQSGSTVAYLSISMLKNFILPTPPLSLQQSFAQKVESIERQKELINQSIREAQTLFDSRMEYYFGE